MEKIVYDNEKYDYLSIMLQTQKTDEMLSVYKKFLWEEVSRIENKNNPNVYYITFRRPHHIKNKDRLQYLQVAMENAINNASTKFFTMHLKSLLFCSILSLIFVSLFVFSVLFFANPFTKLTSILSYVILPISTISEIFTIIKSKQMFVKEKNTYYIMAKNSAEELKRIFDEARKLNKGENY